jgi:hypothetical protein
MNAMLRMSASFRAAPEWRRRQSEPATTRLQPQNSAGPRAKFKTHAPKLASWFKNSHIIEGNRRDAVHRLVERCAYRSRRARNRHGRLCSDRLARHASAHARRRSRRCNPLIEPPPESDKFRHFGLWRALSLLIFHCVIVAVDRARARCVVQLFESDFEKVQPRKWPGFTPPRATALCRRSVAYYCTAAYSGAPAGADR